MSRTASGPHLPPEHLRLEADRALGVGPKRVDPAGEASPVPVIPPHLSPRTHARTRRGGATRCRAGPAGSPRVSPPTSPNVHDDDLELEIATPAISQSADPS